MSRRNKTRYFVKYPLGLSYLFTPGESRFILHMIDVENMKKFGYNTGWTRSEYMKRMGLNEYTFNKTVEKLSGIGLLTKTNNKLGNRVYYTFNMELYNRLVTILSSTNNIDKLIAFCELNFKKGNRSIESITDEEIQSLEKDKT